MAATRARLPRDTGLIGFVGGPWTLFVYAVEGTHAGALERAKSAKALYRAFADRVTPLLQENIRLQFDGGADVVMVFDTAAGELAPDVFARDISPDLERAGPHVSAAPRVLRQRAAAGASRGMRLGRRVAVGRSRPRLALGSGGHARRERPDGLRAGQLRSRAPAARPRAISSRTSGQFVAPLQQLKPRDRRGWICGLGHGVLPNTPEANVRAFVNLVRESFA